MPENRRTFLMWFGVGWLASSLPVVLAACSNQTTNQTTDQKSQPEPTAGATFLAVGTVADLDKSGQLLNENSSIGPVLVVRADKAAASNLVAVNPTCSHKGCPVAWQESGKKFACPCHGSEYDATGKVLKGPAEKPLKSYAAKIEGNSVLVKPS